MERKFTRVIKSLDQIFEFIHQFNTDNQISEAVKYSIDLVIEEVFTNMVKYNPDNKNEITLSIKKDDNKIIICLIDYDVDSYDITKTGEIDLRQPLINRKVGGLGLHLIKNMVDDINYEYHNRESRITLIKHLED